MVITRAPEHPQGSAFDQQLPTMSPEALVHPGGGKLIKINSFKGFLGGHIRWIILLIGLPSKAWWIAALLNLGGEC